MLGGVTVPPPTYFGDIAGSSCCCCCPYLGEIEYLGDVVGVFEEEDEDAEADGPDDACVVAEEELCDGDWPFEDEEDNLGI